MMRNFYFVISMALITLFASEIYAQEVVHPTKVVTGKFFGKTPNLRDIKPIKKDEINTERINSATEQDEDRELNKSLRGAREYPYAATAQPQGPDPVWQNTMPNQRADSRAPILNFAGQSTGAYPSDCNGAVGANHFMQGVNSSYAIYDKNTGTQVVGSTAFNTLFTGVTGSTSNDGDIIVLYDENADRWFASEFSISGSNDYMLIAVSETNDPTGAWYRWSFDVDDMPDYMKFGIWEDGYYMADNNTSGDDIYIFERSVMITGGASPQMISFNNPNRPNSGFHCIEPLDNDGQWAPSGTPGQFITINDDAWGGGGDELWIYECDVDWVTTSNSTFARTQTITVPSFDSNFGASWDNIAQPGTSQELDAIPQILMYRTQYRNFGTTQTIVCAHSVDVDNTDHAGVRWYELQSTGAAWTVRQSGTYAPDGDSRWLPSIAMDGQHNISIAYNVSSSTTFPSIRYAAQSATENASASGIMDIAEESIQVGTSSQTAANRWGDYAEMSIDPVDDVTFWFTTEYFNGGKRTKIANWRFGVASLPPNTNFVINTPNTLIRPVPLLEGDDATYTNLTTGTVDSWAWDIEGGTPNSSTNQDPGTINYPTTGLYYTELTATNTYGDSTLRRSEYIRVIDPNNIFCDTILQFYGSPSIYTSTGGYVGGTNEYDCKAIAEKYDNFTPYNKLTGGRFFWAKATNGTSPNVTFAVWSDDGSGNPGIQIATKILPLADIVNDAATLGYTDVAFDADVILPSTGAFFIGFEIPTNSASGDTLAIVTNTDADGSDNTGYSLYTSWSDYSAWSMSLMNAILAYGCYDPDLAPVADFVGNPTTVNAGSTVDFTDLSYGGAVTSWSWSFSGGTPVTSNLQNPTITYNTSGYYDVTLTVSNANGTDAETKIAYIHVVDANSCSCADLGNVVGNEVLYSTGSGYVSGNNNYGDLTKAEYFDNYAPFTNLEGAYFSFGMAYVDNASTNITINVYADDGGNSVGGTYAYSPGTILASTTININDIKNDIDNGDSTYVSFGSLSIPGNFYIGFIIPNPTGGGDSIAIRTGAQNSGTDKGWEQWSDNDWYSYEEAGWGGTFNNAIYPVVCNTGAPMPDFEANNTIIAAGNTVDFTDMSTCSPTSWNWSLQAGTPATSTQQNPSITYNTAGIYDVTLTATNADGSNVLTKTAYITVLEPIVYWDFPNDPDNDLSDGGIVANTGTKSITTFGGAGAPSFGANGASTNAAIARTFTNGADTKGWLVDFTTIGYGSLVLYSKQNGDARSPRDWKVQYSTDGSTWTDLPGATITCATDWTTGVLNGISLPVSLENQTDVYLRWIMTSNTGINGNLSDWRDNLIDDIMVVGIAIGAPPVTDFTADVTSVCEGATVTFTDNSTNSPTSWSWNFGDASTSTVQNPSHVYATAGTYTVALTATNAAGSDTYTQTNYITVNASPTVSTSVNDVNCFGGNDGDATAVGAAGLAPYTFVWNTGGTSATISTLTAGTYTVTVTDANTCTGTGSATVGQPTSALSANITATSNVNCFGGNDGSATVTASNGTSPYTYAWPSGNTNAAETGLIAGTYIVTVTDGNSCTTTASATISQPASALSTLISGNDINCFGANTGDATVSASDGTSPYTYAWGGGQTTATISNLIAGTYNVTVTDGNSCISTETITITEPATALSTSITGNDVNCNGGNDGDATVSASDGTSPYTYLWNGGQTTATISSLSAGTYTVTVSDGNNCTSIENITINEPATGLSTSITGNDISCNGVNDGDATVTASSGTTPYNYLWGGGQTTATISSLSANTYNVTVTDGNGCTSAESIVITEPSALSTSISGTNIDCNGNSTGTASVTASDGTPSYTYLWGGGQTTNTITGLSAGSYSCVITDANLCTSSENITLTEPTALTLSIAGTDASCNGSSDGSAIATVGGGTTAYTYAWSSGGSAATESGLAANTYTLTVTDGNSCTITDNIVIGEPSVIVISETHNDETCGGSNGDITASAIGGSGSFTYAWSSGDNTALTSSLSAGTYTVTVTDGASCTNSLAVSISNIAGPSVTMSSTDALCNGGNDGTATVVASAGTTPYLYSWSTGGTSSSISGLSAGSYSVTVSDANTCSAIGNVTIGEPSALSTSISGTNIDCNGNSTGTASVTASDGTPSYTYLWGGGQTTNTITGLSAGSYSCVITDANLCTSSENITITEPSALTLSIAGTDANCNGSLDGSAIATVGGGTTAYTYAWSSGGSAATESGLAANTYTLTVTDDNSCTITDNIVIGEPSIILISETHNDATCGNSDGDITASATGGAGSYTYAWSNGDSGANITGLIAGTYTVTVSDGNTCTNTLAVSISNIGGPTLTMGSTDVTCNGGNNGEATVTATDGTTPYTYLWSSGGTSDTETGLTAGTYTVTVSDGNTCSASGNITVNEPNAITATALITDVDCNGGSDGEISLTVTGGTSPYVGFVWTPSTSTSNPATGLLAGNYNVTVTDNAGCTQVLTNYTVNEPTAISVAQTITDATCYGGNDGSASLNVSGGTSPYTYAWSSGGNGAIETGLTAGNYTVTVTDNHSCSTVENITIDEGTEIVLTMNSTDATCGATNGAADVVVSGGTIPYTYNWNTGGTTNSITSLASGNYTVTVTDGNTCTNTSAISISDVGGPALTMGSTDVTCNGYSDGEATVTATGGTTPYTYLWSSGGTSDTEIGIIAGTYTVTVTDGSSCSTSGNVTVNEPTAITATASITDVNCNGGNDGGISLIVSGGDGSYTYAWSNAGNSNPLTGLTAGTYDLTITDGVGCTQTFGSYTVNEPTAISVAQTITDATCYGGNDGSATLNVSGGTSPYIYAWSSGGNGATETGLIAGSYTVTITDNHSCTTVENVIVGEGAEIVLTMNSTDATCGATNGTADVTVSGGTTPYGYNWNTGSTANSLSSIAAGVYSVTVTDGVSCTANSFVNVNNIGGPTLTMATTDVSCFGANDGTATVSASGVAPYTYAWSSGGTSDTETGLSGGSFVVTVTDASTCSSTSIATINEPAQLVVTETINDATCGGCTDGSITLIVTGGTTPYNYSWSTGANSQDLTNIGAGSYTVTVIDNNGCQVIETYNISEPSSITITIVSETDASCYGICDGTATISVAGGTLPYTYAWPTGGVGTTENGLCAGTHTVTVTDASSTISTQDITIIEPSEIAITFTSNDATCSVADGSATASVTGGTSPYTYLWSSGSSTDSEININAGTYYLTVTDANSCTGIDSVTINNIGGPTLTITSTNVSCFGLSDGTATVVANGGASPYTYAWTSGGTSDIETGLAAGSYTVTVTDASSCSSTSLVSITEPTEIVATETITDVSCAGSSDGSISIVVSGGSSPYNYNWSSGGTNAIETNLAGGSYSVTVTDNNACTFVGTYTINEGPALNMSLVSYSDVSCNGGNNGDAIVNLDGGTNPVTYTWNNGSIGNTIYNLEVGTYNVTAVDANGCTANMDVTINEPIAMTVDVTTIDAHCGNSDGTATLAVSGGTSPYNYLWSDGSTTDGLIDLAMGIYIVTVTDANGCQQVITNVINNTDAPDVSITGTDVYCNGGNDGTLTSFVTGGTSPYTYAWSTGGTDANLDSLTAGTYVLTVTDDNNCASISTYKITQPDVGISITPSVTEASCLEKNDGSILLDVEFGTEPYVFAWDNGEISDYLENLSSGSYLVTITDANNCLSTDSIYVGSVLESCLHIYNTLTPNGDGRNDTWIIDGIENFQNVNVKVFNQWGSLVWEHSGYYEAWDGTNKGKLLPAATYYYILELGNDEKPIRGDITLIISAGNRVPIKPDTDLPIMQKDKKSNNSETDNL